MKRKHLPTPLTLAALALPLTAKLKHHYTFDNTLSDAGTGGLDLTLGSAASLDSVCYRAGSGSLRLTIENSTDTRPDSLPDGFASVGFGVQGFDGAYTTGEVDPTTFANGDAMTIAAWILPSRELSSDPSPGIVTFGTIPGTGLVLT